MADLSFQIAENVARVRDRLAEAASRAGRAPEDVRLVAVSKYVGPEVIRALVAAGCTTLGESRPQHFCEKATALTDLDIRWHMIGHLQRNKIRRTLPLVAMVESADSPRLVAAIDRIAGELGLIMPILLEVNISGDDAKDGFSPDAVEPCFEELAQYRNVRVEGLMGMASFEGGLDAARRDFARLRELRDELRQRCPNEIAMQELSMGMSRDFEAAIEEGATIVRVGSALYEGVIR